MWFFFFSRHRDETARRRHRQSRTQQPQLMMRFIKHSPTHTQMSRGRFFAFVKIASKTFPSDYTFLPRSLLFVLRSSGKLSSRATFPSSFSIKAARDFHASGCKNEGGKRKTNTVEPTFLSTSLRFHEVLLRQFPQSSPCSSLRRDLQQLQ